jgi:hypothetical protein
MVIDHFFECSGAVVVKMRRGVPDPAQPWNVELVPIVNGRRPADEPGQEKNAVIDRRL